MGKLPLTLLAAATLLAGNLPAASVPAEAGGFHDRHHGYHHHHGHKKFHHGHHWRHRGHHWHHRHHHDGDDFLLGVGIIGGAVILGSMLTQPRYAPPPVYYYPLPPPRGTCVQDQVYRTLPDGRIQWGTRTRCY